MPTHYEFLQLLPDANIDAIQSSCDQLYSHWLRLVTHHDPKVVDQANDMLRTIEKVREMLIDPEKRAAYNVSVGLQDTIGGLFDASISPNATSVLAPPIPPLSNPPPSSSFNARTDVWTCPRCHYGNEKGNRFCKNCGNNLAQACPNCRQLFEQDAHFCPSCGERPDDFRRRKEAAEVASREQAHAKIVQYVNTQFEQVESQLQSGQYREAEKILSTLSTNKLSVEDASTRDRVRTLQRQAKMTKNSMIWKLTPYTIVVCTVISFIISIVFFSQSVNEALLSTMTGVVVGLIWPQLYFRLFGGKAVAKTQYTRAIASGVAIATIVPLSVGAVIYVIIVILSLSFLAFSMRR